MVIGVDSTLATSGLLVWDRDFWNQLFVATDTLIESITVWRVPSDTADLTPLKIYIMRVDSSLGVERPDWHNVLLDGPSISVAGGDGVHSVPLTWSFDPPFALPHRGQFSFELKPTPCYGAVGIIAAPNNPYPDGGVWQMDPGACDVGCCPSQRAGPDIDMAFRVVFCEPSVPTRPVTWGSLKAQYR